MDDNVDKKQQSVPNGIESADAFTESNDNVDVLLEVVSQDQYALSYTFFIIPELPSFELTGELVEALPRWLNEICGTKGWKLEFVTVDPNYLQWALTVSTSVLTSQIVIQVRTELTKLILDTLNETMDLKDSTDLWAPGYLLLHGLHQNPIGIIEQYTRLVREQQQK